MRVRNLWLAWIIVGLAAMTCAAQPLKVNEKDGHVSPVRAKLTFLDGRTREVVVAGIGGLGSTYHPYNFFVRTEDGLSKRALWIDAIALITGLERVRTTQSEFTIVLKDGSEVSAMFVNAHPGAGFGCEVAQTLTDPSDACSALVIVNQDDGHERMDMRKLKSVEFLPPARKDKAGHAMFEPWRYSPYTGEKLAAN